MKKYPERTNRDKVADSLHASAQLIPLGIGGAVSEFIKQFFPNGFEKRKEEWLICLFDKVENLPKDIQNKIIHYLETEEGKTLLIKTVIAAISTHKIEKYNAMRDVLIGTIENDNLHYDKKEIYVNIICELEPYDLVLLKIISNHHEELASIENYETALNFVNKHGFEGGKDEFHIIINKLKDKSLIRISDHIGGFNDVYSANVVINGGDTDQPYLIVTDLTKQIISYLTNNKISK